MNIDLTPIFQAIIALLAALVTYKLIPWIKARTTKEQQEGLVAAAKIAVYAAEQMYGAKNGDMKLDYARNVLLAAGYDIDTTVLRAAIENAVHTLPIWVDGIVADDEKEEPEEDDVIPKEHPPE